MKSPKMAAPIKLGLVLVNLVVALLPLAVLTWVLKLEKIGCECSQDWRRTYIAFYSIFTLVLLAGVILGTIGDIPVLMQTSGITSFVLGLLFVIFGLQYVHKLKVTKCGCSEDFRREVLYVWNIVTAIMFFFGFLLAFFVALFWAASKKKK